MKNILLFLAVASMTISGCSKKNDNEPSPSKGSSTTVFYIQRTQVYSTDLNGENKKLVIDEVNKSNNNYISSISIVGKNKQLAYVFADDTNGKFYIRTCNFDGTNIKTIKEIVSKDTYIEFFKGLSNGKIIYQTRVFILGGAAYADNSYSVNLDGTAETNINGIGYYNTAASLISADGSAFLTYNDGMFTQIVNNVADKANAHSIYGNDAESNYGVSLSGDGKWVGFLSVSADKKAEIRIKSTQKDAVASTVLATIDVPAGTDSEQINICFANGSESILLNFGTYTPPLGSVNDQTTCNLIDVASKKITKTWKLTGGAARYLVVD